MDSLETTELCAITCCPRSKNRSLDSPPTLDPSAPRLARIPSVSRVHSSPDHVRIGAFAVLKSSSVSKQYVACPDAMSLDPNLNFIIKPLTARDLPKVQDLHAKILPIRYPTSFFLQLLLIPSRACFIAYRNNIPVGFISVVIQKSPPNFAADPTAPSHLSCQHSPDPDLSRPRLEILTLGVLPSYRQRGLARRLVQSVLDSFSESRATNTLDGTLIYANVSSSNIRALKFYERMGMSIQSDIIKNLYRTLSYGSRDAYLVVGVL